MPIPAPGADEDATPIYGIRKPKSIQKAKWIWRAIARIGDDVEAALGIFGLPPVVSTSSVVAASAAARDAHWGTPGTAAARRALQDLGATTIRTDKGYSERYLAGLTDGGANPGGALAAGWYPVAGRMPSAKILIGTGAQVLTTGVEAVVTAFTGPPTAGAWADTATVGAGTITIPISGRYRVSASLSFAANATGVRLGGVNKNSAVPGTNQLFRLALTPGSAVDNTVICGADELDLVAGDVLRISAYQNSGGNLGLVNTTTHAGHGASNFLEATLIGPS